MRSFAGHLKWNWCQLALRPILHVWVLEPENKMMSDRGCQDIVEGTEIFVSVGHGGGDLLTCQWDSLTQILPAIKGNEGNDCDCRTNFILETSSFGWIMGKIQETVHCVLFLAAYLVREVDSEPKMMPRKILHDGFSQIFVGDDHVRSSMLKKGQDLAAQHVGNVRATRAPSCHCDWGVPSGDEHQQQALCPPPGDGVYLQCDCSTLWMHSWSHRNV